MPGAIKVSELAVLSADTVGRRRRDGNVERERSRQRSRWE